MAELDMNLLMKYLSGAGAALSQGQQAAPALDLITQEQIKKEEATATNENYMKMLQTILAGGGKISLDGKKTNISMDADLMGGGVGSEIGDMSGRQVDRGTTGGKSTQPTQQQSQIQTQPQQRQPDIFEAMAASGVDLAGMTPQMIMQALQLGQTQKGSTADIAYKQALTRQADRAGQPGQPFPIAIPGVGQVDLKTWNAMPKDEQEYAAYAHTAKRLGDSDIMTKKEFMTKLDRTDREMFLREAMDDPKLMESAKELAASGATSISLGERLDIKAQKYFTDPKGLVADVDKYINTENVQSNLMQHEIGSPERETAILTEKEKFIKGKIAASGGKIIKSELDGRDFVWTVKWPDKSITEVRYAN